MVFPLESLIEFDDNIYEITYVATRRAEQLAALQASNEIDPKVNIVSEAAKQVFHKEIEYQIASEVF